MDHTVPLPQLSIPAALRAVAARLPDAVALRHPGGTVSFALLAARMDGLACALRERGIGPGDRVGVHLARSPEMITGVLGVLAAGSAYVPLDPEHPSLRLRTVAEDAHLALVLSDDDAAQLAGVATFGHFAPAKWPDHGDGPPPPPPRLSDPAYLIYTSGSTGRPKGVVVEHGALGNYLSWCLHALPATGGGAPLFSTLAFDHSVTSLYPPLLQGEPLTLLGPLQGGRELARQLLDGHHYSFVKITPSHLRLLSLDDRARLGASADLVMLGGERSSGELVAQLRRDSPAVAVMNHYGPTEATVGCCTYLAPIPSEPGPLPIGRPIPGVGIRVHMTSTAPGSAGELYVGGIGLARGYWARPDLTAAAFVATREADGTEDRWYRTGDLVRQREDGVLEYLGRVDQQIKILGHRIEPAEVEAALRAASGADDAAVVADEGPEGTSLVAAIAGAPAGADAEAVRRRARDYLPAAMIPAHIFFVERLPVTANGKLDRAVLLDLHRGAEGDLRAQPAGDAEARIAAIWRAVLGKGPVGYDDDFFEMGGDSLASVEVVTRISTAFGVNLDLAALFDAPTVRTLAALVRQDRD